MRALLPQTRALPEYDLCRAPARFDSWLVPLWLVIMPGCIAFAAIAHAVVPLHAHSFMLHSQRPQTVQAERAPWVSRFGQLQLTALGEQHVQAAQIRCQLHYRARREQTRDAPAGGPVDFQAAHARGNPRQPSLVLFNAYREPAWSAAEHSRVGYGLGQAQPRPRAVRA